MLKLTFNDAVIYAISFMIIGNYSGVANWDDEMSTCEGKYNNPPDQDTFRIVQKEFSKINMSGFDKPAKSAELINNGYKVHLNLSYDILPTIKGGPIPKNNGDYIFAHINFHWRGNETNVDYYENEAMSAELHLVFYNDMYFSLNEALNNDDGIVVMAFSFWAVDYENVHYIELISLLSQVSGPNRRASLINPPKLTDLIVKPDFYFSTYKGSLTTAPCSRDVIWLDFDETISLSMEQYFTLERYFKQGIIKQNPKLKTTIYEQMNSRNDPTDPNQGVPFIYSNSKANNHYIIAIEAWIILITFGIFQYLLTVDTGASL